MVEESSSDSEEETERLPIGGSLPPLPPALDRVIVKKGYDPKLGKQS